ncbi:MAG: hypothetical protein WBP61_14990, partial [Nocardioides sp.]
PTLLVLALVSLAGCGGSDTAASETEEVVSDIGQSVGGDGDAELQGSSELDALGYALDSVLSGADGYQIEGETLTVTMGGSSDDTSSACTIALTAGAGVVSTPFTLVLAYDDGDVTCEE